MSKQKVKYKEGQWFAVPLCDGGYALGIIVRGGMKTKGGLGYFFGPKFFEIPKSIETFTKNKDNAVLICCFGDLGIINGEWPLLENGKPFVRQEWPVPLFYRIPSYLKDKAVIVDYGQDFSGLDLPISETIVKLTDEIVKLPEDVSSGYGAVEIKLTGILNGK